jgi:hypothetical protein
MLKRLILGLFLVFGQAWGGDQPVLMTGAIGGGLFLPTGDDADVADLSPSIELNGSFSVAPNWGLESEFIYIPIQLQADTLRTRGQRKSSQITVLAGLRLTTSLQGQGRPTAALSVRGGFARVATTARTATPQSGWIGGTIDDIENPTVNQPAIRTTDAAFALSPRIAISFPLSGMSSVEVGLSPVFLFNRGTVSTQMHLGARFALSAHGSM